MIVAARKGGRGAFRLLAPLVLHAAPAHSGDGEVGWWTELFHGDGGDGGDGGD